MDEHLWEKTATVGGTAGERYVDPSLCLKVEGTVPRGLLYLTASRTFGTCSGSGVV